MMKKLVVLVALVFLGVILAGCLGPGPSQNMPNPSNTATGSQSSGIILPGGKIDMSKITSLADLGKLGVGVKCTGEERDSDEVLHAEYWVKGGNWKLKTTGSENSTAICRTEENGVFTYIKIMDEEIGCDWIKIPGGSAGEYPGLGSASLHTVTPDGVRIDRSWECHVENIPDSVFNVDGKVCTFQELRQMYMQEYGD